MNRRRQETLQECKRESHILIEDKEIDGISMVSHHLQLPQRHTSRVTVYIVSRHGAHMSQPARTSGQLNPIDFRRPIGVMANGPDGLARSDNRSQTSGVALPDGIRLPPAGDDSSWKKVSDWEGSQWSAPTRRTLKGSEYETDQEWHLRNMRYGDGWAYDSTQSHCK